MNRHRDRSNGRLRVHVAVLITLFALQFATLLRAEEPAVPPLMLVHANTATEPDGSGGYTTSFLATAQDGATEVQEAVLTNGACGGFGYNLKVAPMDIKYVEKISNLLCDPKPFELLPAPTNIDVVSILQFDKSPDRSSIEIPAIGAVWKDHPSHVGGLVNHGNLRSFVTTFAKEPTPLRLTMYGGLYLFLPWVEDFTANDKVPVKDGEGKIIAWVIPPVSQYEVSALGAFFMTVEIPPCDLGPCAVYAPVYGFASRGDLKGGTFKAFPFGK